MSDEGYERQFIDGAFGKNYIAPLGENVDAFEREMGRKLGAEAAVALSSGTAAMHMALKALGVGEGDLIFCQSLTFAATAYPILYENAIPVFIDSDRETWNMSPDALERAFNKYEYMGKKPKAVIAVHLYGLSANLERIISICDNYSVPVIEDAAESLGTTYMGEYTGTLGTGGIFSFNGNKIITTSGGGMLIWNKSHDNKTPREITDKVRFWSSQSRDPARHYQHSEIGYNYQMSNISAGIGRGQLMVLDERIGKKRYIYNYYKSAFGELPNVEMMPARGTENCWLTAVKLTGGVLPLDIIRLLEARGIEARHIWKPLHTQPLFKKYDYIDAGGVSEELFARGLCLPSDTKMTDEDLEMVCGIVKEGLEKP